jgi:hypothetical protein
MNAASLKTQPARANLPMHDLNSHDLNSYYDEIDYAEIFGNDSGEDEPPELLAAYFVDIPEFKRFFSQDQKLAIVRAKKGMGKSALLSHLAYRIEHSAAKDEKSLVIKITGNDLVGLADFSGTDQAVLENKWKQVICKRICLEIAKRIDFAASDDQMGLVEMAELEGFKGRNLVSSLKHRVGGVIDGLSKSLLGVNVGAAIGAAAPQARAYEEILDRLNEMKESTVWVLIDDIDAKYVDTVENQQRVGAFFSAIRSLSFSLEGLRMRASVRTDVWTNLRTMEDQDKLRQYVIDIKWKDEALKRIFSKKILAYLQRCNPSQFASWHEDSNYRQIVAEIFDKNFRTNKNAQEDPFTVVVMLAGRRPRWMGQLCKLAGTNAERAKIGQIHFAEAMHDFGKEKLTDLVKEHSHQFMDLSKLVDTFRRTGKECTRHQLCSNIERMYLDRAEQPYHKVNGYDLKSVDQLGELLFEVDFIAAHKVDSKRWLSYADDPDLFNSELNKQNKVMWSVNLSYRGFLNIGNGQIYG